MVLLPDVNESIYSNSKINQLLSPLIFLSTNENRKTKFITKTKLSKQHFDLVYLEKILYI